MANHNDERMSGAVDQAVFEQAIRDNLSPDGVATVIAWLRAAESGNQPADERALAALREVEWLADTLTEMLGAEEHNRLMDELGL
jgi:hypothetical protein